MGPCLLLIGILIRAFYSSPQNLQLAIPWSYFGLGVLFGVFVLVGIFRVAKNLDEKNEDKVVQGLNMTVSCTLGVIIFSAFAFLLLAEI